MQPGGPQPALGPVFVGGTGRCGTHAVAALAGSGGDYGVVPAELRLHTDMTGLAGYIGGESTRASLARDLLTGWWRRPAPWDPGELRGTHRISPRGRNLRAVARLLAAAPGADRSRLCRRYVSDLLDPAAPSPSAWVEKTPENCAAAPFLIGLFPQLRLVHVVRDGRDVACSLMRLPWAPSGFEAALALWEQSLLRADRGLAGIPAAHAHCLLLEDLVLRDRERTYRGLLEFLELADTPARRAFFESELTPDRARIGRWRRDLPDSARGRANRLYRGALRRLGEAGVRPLPPPLEQAPPLASPRAVSGIDPWAAMTA